MLEGKKRVLEFLAKPENRAEFLKADVILGVDRMDPSNESLFYGESRLKRIVRKGQEETLKVLKVPISFSSKRDEVEQLAAACKTLRGSCCYQGDGEQGLPIIDPRFN